MRISTIITTYNRPEALENCLKSVLLQTSPPAEIIVVESGPFDASKSLIDRYKNLFKEIEVELRYLRNIEGSLTNAKDLGIKNSNFEIISFLDDDVIIDREYYKAIMEVYEKNTTCIRSHGQESV